MVSARFQLVMVASPTNSKSSIVIVQSIHINGAEEAYLLPPEAQPISLHTELLKNSTVSRTVKAMTQRGQNRRLIVELDGALKEVYLDNDGNLMFGEHFLVEVEPESLKPVAPPRILNSAASAGIQEHAHDQKKSLQSITKDMVLVKYANKTQNAEVWLRSFNSECDRLGVVKNRKAEAMRLFLEKSPLEWFNAQWTTNYEDTWEDWTQNFLEAFGDKGWNEVWSAINLKHTPGTSMSEYIIKKNSLLIDALPEMNEKCRVAIICVGIDWKVREKIDRNSITTQGKLLSEITKWETPQNSYRHRSKGTSQPVGDGRDGKNENGKGPNDRKPCRWCEKRGFFKGTNHPEKVCWNNPSHPDYRERGGNVTKRNTGMHNNQDKMIRVANNTELEDMLNEKVNSKN